MNVYKFECPCCGASLDVEDGLEVMYCRYCGAHLQVDGLSDGMVNAKVHLRELEHDERMRDKRYAYKRFKLSANLGSKFLEPISIVLPFIVLILVILLIGAVPSCSHQMKVSELKQVENQIIEDIGNGNYDEALVLCNKLRLDDHWSSEETRDWEARRKEYVQIINERVAEEKGEPAPEREEEKPWWQFW